MRFERTKNFRKIAFTVILMVLAISVCCSTVNATEPSIKAYIAERYEGKQLVTGEKYYVVESNIDSEVYVTDSIVAASVEAIEPTKLNYWGKYEFDYRYYLADGSTFYKNVKTIENKGHFDGCPYGTVIYKNDKNLVDKNTDKNLSGSSNEYLYWCDGGGVENLTVFLFKDLEETTITADDITVKQKTEFKEGDIPTEDDFEVIVTKGGKEYVMSSGKNTSDPFYILVEPEEIKSGENTIKILVKDLIEKEITVKPVEETIEEEPAEEPVEEEKDETPKTGIENNYILFLETVTAISLAVIFIRKI